MLISDDVVIALQQFPPDLRLQIAQYAPQPDWDEYMTGKYKETKKKDSSLLGGGKPVIAPGMRNGASQWKVDEEDSAADATADQDLGEENEEGTLRGELKRHIRTTREVSADFGAAPMDDEEDDDDDDDESHVGAPHVGPLF